MCTHTGTHTQAHTHTHTHTYTHTHTHAYTHKYTGTNTRTHVNVRTQYTTRTSVRRQVPPEERTMVIPEGEDKDVSCLMDELKEHFRRTGSLSDAAKEAHKQVELYVRILSVFCSYAFPTLRPARQKCEQAAFMSCHIARKITACPPPLARCSLSWLSWGQVQHMWTCQNWTLQPACKWSVE